MSLGDSCPSSVQGHHSSPVAEPQMQSDPLCVSSVVLRVLPNESMTAGPRTWARGAQEDRSLTFAFTRTLVPSSHEEGVGFMPASGRQQAHGHLCPALLPHPLEATRPLLFCPLTQLQVLSTCTGRSLSVSLPHVVTPEAPSVPCDDP